MNDQELEAAFLARAGGHLAPATLASYRAELTKFRRELERAGAWPGWPNLTAAQVQAEFRRIEQTGNSLSTWRRIATSLRQFYLDLLAQGVVATSPLVGLQPSALENSGRGRTRTRPTMTYQELMALVPEMIRDATPAEKALVTLLVVTGLRSGELIALKDSDFDWSLDLLFVQDWRGRARYLQVDEHVHEAVVAYQRHRQPASVEGTLFINHRGDPARSEWVSRTIRALSGDRLTPVAIRNIMIRHWVQTLGAKRAAQLAGHRQVSTAAAYQTAPTPNLRKNYEQYFYGDDDDDDQD